MKNYPAKLLLFGEHTVNLGSQALAMPLPIFSGKWATANQLGPSELVEQQMQLPQLADYLDQLQQRGELLAPLDVPAFRQAVVEGLVFESNIPTGCGTGSSGAIVAAIFDRWQNANVNWQNELPTLKNLLAQMESFFHGTSSGTDPLICFLQKTVLLGGVNGVEIVEPVNGSSESPHTIFLLDTGIQRQATPFITYFLEKTKDENFGALVREELLPSVAAAIQGFLEGDAQRVFEETHSIGEFQLLFLEKMVPEAFQHIWRVGLDGELFKLKVCGAGGGGFLLGVSSDFEATMAVLNDYKLIPVLTI